MSVAFAKSGNELRSGSVVPCGFMRLRGIGAGRESYRTVGDWRVSAERLEGDAAAILERLLATPATSRPAPECRRGWLVRLALQGDRALILHDEGNRRAAAGLFDPSSESLVLAVGSAGSPGHWAPEAIRSHGSEAPLPELMALLADADDLQVEQLQIVAVRRGDPLPEGGGRPTWVLERPQHRFLVRA